MNGYQKYSNVFKPLKVGNLILKNRIQFPPMVCCQSSAYGEVSQQYVDFIRMQARTGAALVTIGATPIDEETGQDYYGELNITDDAMVPGLSRIATAAHDYGAKISIEMVHGGRGAAPALLKTPYALAPSAFPLADKNRYVKEMDQNEIDHIIWKYADCADRLARAGFDMCMVHAAHGNLLGQFMSPHTNTRTDWYGGSFENRMRFPLQVLEAIRAKVGNRIAIEMRISGDEIIPEGMHIEDALKFLPMAEPYVDLVNVSRGLIVDTRYSFYTQPPYYHEYGHNVKYAEAIKKVISIPVSVVGSIKTLDLAEDIISSGKADMVSMCRQLLADSDTIKKSFAGRPETVRPCLRCLQVCNKNCDDGRPVRCAVNPLMGRESEIPEIRPAKKQKKVVVVGGGCAGMMAAQTLTERGHQVILFEARGQLGGHLPEINKLPFKQDLREYTDWDIRTTMKCGADIRLNTKATPELVAVEHPAAIIVATGSRLFIPNIPGIDGPNVTDVISADCELAEIGQNVIVCGGGMSDLECALGLAMKGRDVTVLDMVPTESFAKEIVKFTRNMLLHLLKEHNVKLVGEQMVRKITSEGVETADRNWKTHLYKCDTVVTAFGLKPNDELIHEFMGLADEVYPVGDCYYGEKSIGNANMTAFNFSMEI